MAEDEPTSPVRGVAPATGYWGTAQTAHGQVNSNYLEGLVSMPIMNPVAALPVEEVRQLRRNVFCGHYDACLDEAIQKGWENFSCSHCNCFCAYTCSDIEWFNELEGCAYLIAVIFGFRFLPASSNWGLGSVRDERW